MLHQITVRTWDGSCPYILESQAAFSSKNVLYQANKLKQSFVCGLVGIIVTKSRLGNSGGIYIADINCCALIGLPKSWQGKRNVCHRRCAGHDRVFISMSAPLIATRNDFCTTDPSFFTDEMKIQKRKK